MKSPAYTTIDEYIATFAEPVRARLEQVRATIRAVAPEATETIKYGIPTYVLGGSNLVHFGGYKEHIGFYPTPTGMAAFADDLARYGAGKGTARFPHDEPLPLELIRRITEYRVKGVGSRE
jgi:uncharacterized protein YdhG (YjbR/CyaY superfamily)